MELKNIREKINEGVYLNLINTNKFKTNLISVYIIRPLMKEEVSMNALIPLILKRGTKNLKTALDIQKQLEELYGSNLSINASKKGERQVIRISIEGPEEAFVGHENLLNEKLKLLNEILTQPLLENETFIEKYVEIEKNNLIEKIKGRINDKKQYAVDRCIEEMCKNEMFGIYKYGNIAAIQKLSSEEIYRHYKEILRTSPIVISIVGNIEKDKAREEIKKVFKFERGEIIQIPRETILKEVHTKNQVFEDMDVKQGKLTLGLRTNIPYEDTLYEPLLLASNILGGGPNSKLFIHVREKASLAYYIYSQTYKFKSLMLIASGIEFKNYRKTLDIIKKQITAIKEGDFTEKDINKSKKSLITSIRTMKDSSFSISEFYLSQFLTKDHRSIEEIIQRIGTITKNEIVKASQNISLDTIYFLRNEVMDKEEYN